MVACTDAHVDDRCACGEQRAGRPDTGNLIPTGMTGTPRKWRHAIRKGSLSDRLFSRWMRSRSARSAAATAAPRAEAGGGDE